MHVVFEVVVELVADGGDGAGEESVDAEGEGEGCRSFVAGVEGEELEALRVRVHDVLTVDGAVEALNLDGGARGVVAGRKGEEEGEEGEGVETHCRGAVMRPCGGVLGPPEVREGPEVKGCDG